MSEEQQYSKEKERQVMGWLIALGIIINVLLFAITKILGVI
jgi:hypothetical protein